MKKKTQTEPTVKLSESADRAVTDTRTAGILLCALLAELKSSLGTEVLYDICVTGGIINFFTYQETIASLLEKGFLTNDGSKEREESYTVTPAGTELAKKLKTLKETSCYEAMLAPAQLAVQRQHSQKDALVTYETLDRGCHLHVLLRDRDLTLLDFRLFTPDTETARQLGERILTNPSALYHDVLQAVISEHKVPAK